MSFVFAGYPIETKPASPRKDVVDGTDGNDPSEFNYTYKMYTDLGLGVGPVNIALIVGDNINVSLEQSIHSAFQRMLSFIQDNIASLVQPAVPYRGYHYTIGLDDSKDQVILEATSTGSTFSELDVVQDKLNLVLYYSDYGEPAYYTADLYVRTGHRLLELAREKRYICTPELIRGVAPIADNLTPAEGDTVTITPPTWTGGTADYTYWCKDGKAIQPRQDGNAPLVLTNVNVFFTGFYQVKAGQLKPDGKAPDQIRTSIGQQIDVIPTAHDVTVAFGPQDVAASGWYGAVKFSADPSNDFGDILNTEVGGGAAVNNGYEVSACRTDDKGRVIIFIHSASNQIPLAHSKVLFEINGREAVFTDNTGTGEYTLVDGTVAREIANNLGDTIPFLMLGSAE